MFQKFLVFQSMHLSGLKVKIRLSKARRNCSSQPAPSVVADQDGDHQVCIGQGDVARAAIACRELRYRRLGVGRADADSVRGFR